MRRVPDPRGGRARRTASALWRELVCSAESGLSSRSRAAFRRLLVLGWIGVLPCGAAALEPPRGGSPDPPGANRLVAEIWRVEDGLPQNSVNAIVQTRDGYIWLGTYDGLARFDGVRFTAFHTGNAPGLGSSRILSLLEGRDGTLWIGTEGGLSRYRRGRFESIGGPSLLGVVNYIHEEREGGIWIHSEGGVARLADDRVTVFSAGDGIPGVVSAVITPRRGGVWLATNRGMARFEGGRFNPFGADLAPGATVSSLEVDESGAVWLGTFDGIVRPMGDRIRAASNREGLPSEAVTALFTDRAGVLWAATKSGGLGRIARGRFEVVALPAGPAGGKLSPKIVQGGDGSLWHLAGGVIQLVRDGEVTSYPVPEELQGIDAWSVLGDREGSLWIGTRGAGLFRLRPALVTTITETEGLRNEEAYAVLETRRGDLWIGTNGGGLGRYDGRGIRTYTLRDGLPNTVVWALCETRDGGLWIGTAGGLALWSEGRISTDVATGGPIRVDVLALLEDREGALWIGTRGKGLLRLRDRRVTTYTKKDGLADDHVRMVHQDRKGRIWIATDGGVTCLSGGKFTNYTTDDGLSDRFVRVVYEDSEGAYWFGTYGNGLNRLKNGKLSAITTRDGLYDHTVSQILEDGRGAFWMTSNRGIYRAAKKELDDFVDGRITSVSCTSYGRSEGMKEAECNGGCQPAGCKARDGRLFFPTAGGVAVVDPRSISLNPLPPPVVIEDASVDGRPLDISAGASLPPGVQRLQIRYTGLSFANPAAVRFQYRLEGFDAGWVDGATRREAVYTNVGPGTYRFRVKACNGDGVWNEVGVAWGFSVAPYFYQTTLFLLLCAAAVGSAGALLGAGVRGVRLRVLMARNAVLKERARIARDIHDTVAQHLTGVGFQLAGAESLLASHPETARDLLVEARDQLRVAQEETRRAVEALRARPVERGGLVEAVRDLGVPSVRGGVELAVDITGRSVPLAGDVEDDVWHIVQEAVTNALRHASCRRIEVSLRFERKRLVAVVSDDGTGFDAPGTDAGRPMVGHGLEGMRERANARGWRLSVEGRPGRGTDVRAEVPLRRGLLARIGRP